MTLKILFIFLLIFIGNAPLSFCQSEITETQTSSGFSGSVSAAIGVTDFHARDEYLSPFIFRGSMFSSKVSYMLKSDYAIHIIDVSYSSGHPATNKISPEITEYTGLISYAFLYKIKSWEQTDNPFDLFIGTGVSSFVNNTDYIASDKTYNYTFYDQSWLWAHSINFHLRAEHKVSSTGNLALQISLPIISSVRRPENGHYFNNRNSDVIQNFMNAAGGGKLKGFWNSFMFTVLVGYNQKLNDQLGLVGSYNFNYSYTEEPLPIKQYTNNFLAGVEWFF